VAKGHTVFAVSWKNPDAADAELGMAEYLRLGVMASLDAVESVVPQRRIHAVGYCLGGTLVAIAGSAMVRDGDDRLASLTVLAAQTDFSEPGELGLFIDESQLAFLEDIMSYQGYLSAKQMAAAFQVLRPGHLIWAPMVRRYLLGERVPMTDLMAWNADGTRMPKRRHAGYLRSLFHENFLAAGRYEVEGRPVSLGDIGVPVFALVSRIDHVAPWRSVYKIHLLCDAEITFVLTEGDHNAGILSEPAHPHGSHRLLTRPKGAPLRGAGCFSRPLAGDIGFLVALFRAMARRAFGAATAPPSMGAPTRGYPPICKAPGAYVLGH
jgi:polyhydroxyalkanoate synthase